MRRLWIGVGLLLGLLAVSLWSMDRMEDAHRNISGELAQAVELLAREDWTRADALLASARSNWEDHRRFTASMADHTTLDEIDAAFAQMEVYRTGRAATACAAACARLAQQIAALEDAYQLNWWNLL